MKFNCDRCKTRYSIADERVRGKVLKIRCKNCSTVITVREGASVVAPRAPSRAGSSAAPRPQPVAAAPRAPSVAAAPGGVGLATTPDHPRHDSALHSAFHDVMGSRQPSAADSLIGGAASPPAEWYLAIEGEQFGPFDLDGARRWVSDQRPGRELHCWSEGFDDWLPVEQVSELARDMPPSRLPVGSAPQLPETEEPKPLFAATMAEVAAEAPTLMEGDDPLSNSYAGRGSASSPPPSASGFELDIGEASRVVNLGSVSGQPPRGDEFPLPEVGPMPKISGLTNPGLELPRPEVLQPRRGTRSPVLIPLIVAIGVLAVILGALLYLALSNDGAGGEQISRTGVGDRDDLTQQFTTGARPSEPESSEAAPVESEPRVARTTRAAEPARPRSQPREVSRVATEPEGYQPPAGEVDLSGAGGLGESVKQGSLDPGDVEAVYRKKQFAVNRCYENAMKRNPLLEVPKTYVTLNINGGGKVTKVSIPALAGEPLGNCLVASIGRWRFPKSTEGFAGRFPIVFRSR